jgi:hypothetical protein
MTQNTMADLRREVARRLRETLHGREIDTLEKGMPELPHMLGIVTLGAISTEKALKGSLLDPDHEFWSDYYTDVKTQNEAESEIESAIHSLKDDGTFTVSTPYGEKAGIWYCEVDEIHAPSNEMITSCAECGEAISVEPNLTQHYGMYTLKFSLDCPSCDFEQTLSTMMQPE